MDPTAAQQHHLDTMMTHRMLAGLSDNPRSSAAKIRFGAHAAVLAREVRTAGRHELHDGAVLRVHYVAVEYLVRLAR